MMIGSTKTVPTRMTARLSGALAACQMVRRSGTTKG